MSRALFAAGAALGLAVFVAAPAPAQEKIPFPQEKIPFLLGPPPADGPVPVRIGFYLRDINRIDEEEQRFEVEGVLTLRWQDPRLAFDPQEAGVAEKIYQGNYQFSEVGTGWWPQVVLANESGDYRRQAMLLRNLPDGSMTYIEEVNVEAEMPIELRRFPFDRQRLELIFEVLGFNRDEVLLRPDPATTGREVHGVNVAQWLLESVSSESRRYDPAYGDGTEGDLASVVVILDVVREPGFMVRVVMLPLAVLVMLSWSVFWMDRESLGGRMDISFIGILTVVAYQTLVSGILPRIHYFTVMSTFIYISFLLMCATVVVNLTVGHLDRSGRRVIGDRVDRHSRWVFPALYAGSIGLSTLYFFTRY